MSTTARTLTRRAARVAVIAAATAALAIGVPAAAFADEAGGDLGTCEVGGLYDLDGDGWRDAGVTDEDGDGWVDTNAIDADGDGAADTWAVDGDEDCALDQLSNDWTGPHYAPDGLADAWLVDDDADGFFEEVLVDSDADGVVDEHYDGYDAWTLALPATVTVPEGAGPWHGDLLDLLRTAVDPYDLV